MSVKKKIDRAMDSDSLHQLLSFAEDLQKTLSFHQQIGIENYPKFDQKLAFNQGGSSDTPGEKQEEKIPQTDSLDDIHKNIKNCSSCSCETSLHGNLLLDVPSPYRLMIVGD